MTWPSVHRIGNTKGAPDSLAVGGGDDANLNKAAVALETRTNILMNRLMCEVWTKRTPAGAFAGSFTSVCWSGSLFVLVGTSGTIQTSPQGIKWTSRTAASSYTGTFQSVCWSATLSLFVAVGATGAIQTSPDGTTWTSRTAGSSYAATFRGLAVSGSRVIAVGASGEVQTSNDGTTWTRRLSGATQFNSVVEIDSGVMVLVGDGGACQVSQDQGTSWSAFGTGTSSNLMAMALSAERRQLFYSGQAGEVGTIDMYSILVGAPSNELRAVLSSSSLN
ncbi:MAG TPA: hypothetical protein VN764_17805, partial [Polyangiaceae bacterium]|nr:hypothetical protein [Polyangiaceae bacterium]